MTHPDIVAMDILDEIRRKNRRLTLLKRAATIVALGSFTVGYAYLAAKTAVNAVKNEESDIHAAAAYCRLPHGPTRTGQWDSLSQRSKTYVMDRCLMQIPPPKP